MKKKTLMMMIFKICCTLLHGTPSCRMLMAMPLLPRVTTRNNLDEDNLSEHLITSDSVPAHSLGDINQTRPPPPLVAIHHHLMAVVVVSKNLKTDSFISSSILYDNITPTKHTIHPRKTLYLESHLITISPL